jgi:hypothetical protein
MISVLLFLFFYRFHSRRKEMEIQHEFLLPRIAPIAVVPRGQRRRAPRRQSNLISRDV